MDSQVPVAEIILPNLFRGKTEDPTALLILGTHSKPDLSECLQNNDPQRHQFAIPQSL